MLLYKFKEPTVPVKYLETDKQVRIPLQYNQKPVRALWVSNVVNIDLPTTEDLKQYQEKLKEIIQIVKDYNLNTIYFQVRTNNDAFYHSKLNPTSRYFVGKEGNPLKFDALKWIIKEAHKNKIELHAWCNPYRVSQSGKIPKAEWLASCSDLNVGDNFISEGLLSVEQIKAKFAKDQAKFIKIKQRYQIYD